MYFFDKKGRKKAFTLIELMVIVAIIALLVVSIYSAIENSRKRARINSVKTTLKSVMTTLVSCGVSGTDPSNFGVVGQPICSSVSGATWPKLPGAYQLRTESGVDFYDYACLFRVDTKGDISTDLVCDCIKQKCDEEP